MNKSAREMFEELGYLKDKEPRFGALVSYTKYCVDGCCRLNDLVFCQNSFSTDETFISLGLLKAINQQCKELGWLDE